MASPLSHCAQGPFSLFGIVRFAKLILFPIYLKKKFSNLTKSLVKFIKLR